MLKTLFLFAKINNYFSKKHTLNDLNIFFYLYSLIIYNEQV
jgi:hypothetical protein